ncbi:MAG: signal peptidase I [Pyrinomonadaceae bacterium]
MAKSNKNEVEKPEIKSKKIEPSSGWAEQFESLAITLIMALFGMTFVIQAVTVPTGSMQNTILVGDYLLVNKFIFNAGGNPLPFLPQRDIRRGDIIVFKYPGNRADPEADRIAGHPAYKLNYVKRVIGLPGETVEFRDNQVFINGKLLPEYREYGAPTGGSPLAALETEKFEERAADDGAYTVYYSKTTFDMIQRGDSVIRSDMNFGIKGKPSVVPENNFFVLGDSRDASEDSRYWGFVPRELIIGRALVVYWSCDRYEAGENNYLGCLTHPRFNRIGNIIR